MLTWRVVCESRPDASSLRSEEKFPRHGRERESILGAWTRGGSGGEEVNECRLGPGAAQLRADEDRSAFFHLFSQSLTPPATIRNNGCASGVVIFWNRRA